jgi:hypothetical protein
VAGPDGRRRLDDPSDFVRLEIETALTRPGMLVLPLLVEGAVMPPADHLPEPLRPLTQLNGAVVRNDPDYQGDMRRVETAVQSALLEQGRKGAWTAGAEAGPADAAKYAPGRVNRGLLTTLGALALLVAFLVFGSAVWAAWLARTSSTRLVTRRAARAAGIRPGWCDRAAGQREVATPQQRGGEPCREPPRGRVMASLHPDEGRIRAPIQNWVIAADLTLSADGVCEVFVLSLIPVLGQ